MNEMEIAVRLEANDHEIGSLKHRTRELEEQSRVIQDLAMSTKELALNMKNMIEVQGRQAQDIERLKSEPANSWKQVKHKMLDTAIGLLAGALVTGAIVMITQYVK